MKRGALGLFALTVTACPAAGSTPAHPPQPETRTVQPEPAPTPEPDSEPEPDPDPSAVAMVTGGPFKDLGFARGEPTPDAPLLRATKLEPFGEQADELASRVVDRIEPVFACLEAHPPAARAWLSARIGLGGEPESVEVNAGPADAIQPQLESCLAQVFEPLRVSDESASGAFAFEYYPRAADAPGLPEPQPGQKAEVRYGGACFVWIEEPPCPPRKRCYTDRWEPSMCPHRANRPDVRLRHDLDGDNVKDGWTTSTAVELVDAQGQPIWRTAWTAEEAGRLPRYDATSKFGDKVFGYIVEYGDTIIRVADQLGVRDYDRRTGERLRTWSAPKASSQYFVDDGSFSARGKTKCKGETDHGQFAQVCGGSLLFFDGYTFAVLDAQTLTQRAITNLDAKTTSRSADGADFVVKLAAGGTKLTVKGILYMD